MVYYIIYPRKKAIKPFIVSHKPNKHEQFVFGGFAEGGFKTKQKAIDRIHEMGYSYKEDVCGYCGYKKCRCEYDEFGNLKGD